VLVKKKAHRLRRGTAGGHAERRLSLPKLASRHMEAAASEVCS